MPQLSLYIDKETLKKLKIAARIEHLSISKYAVKKLNESIHTQWPDHYDDLYGSVEDSSFVAERNVSFSNDAVREEL